MVIVFNGYCFVIYQTDQGVKNLPADRAGVLAGSDPDYNNRMLYNAIADGNPVSLLVSVDRYTVCHLLLLLLLHKSDSLKVIISIGKIHSFRSFIGSSPVPP